jgi:hypothetical protein
MAIIDHTDPRKDIKESITDILQNYETGIVLPGIRQALDKFNRKILVNSISDLEQDFDDFVAPKKKDLVDIITDIGTDFLIGKFIGVAVKSVPFALKKLKEHIDTKGGVKKIIDNLGKSRLIEDSDLMFEYEGEEIPIKSIRANFSGIDYHTASRDFLVKVDELTEDQIGNKAKLGSEYFNEYAASVLSSSLINLKVDINSSIKDSNSKKPVSELEAELAEIEKFIDKITNKISPYFYLLKQQAIISEDDNYLIQLYSATAPVLDRPNNKHIEEFRDYFYDLIQDYVRSVLFVGTTIESTHYSWKKKDPHTLFHLVLKGQTTTTDNYDKFKEKAIKYGVATEENINNVFYYLKMQRKIIKRCLIDYGRAGDGVRVRIHLAAIRVNNRVAIVFREEVDMGIITSDSSCTGHELSYSFLHFVKYSQLHNLALNRNRFKNKRGYLHGPGLDAFSSAYSHIGVHSLLTSPWSWYQGDEEEHKFITQDIHEIEGFETTPP